MSKRLLDSIIGFVFFAAHLVTMTLAYTYVRNLTVSEDKNRFKYIAVNEANHITNCIDKVVVRTYTLREMINENDGDTGFFEKTASAIIQSIKDDTGIVLRNLLLAPDGVVSKVEPYLNNENLIGFSLLDTNYEGNKEALEASMRSKTLLTNPFHLVQGGIGLSARTPVYTHRNEKSEFWGLVSTTMDFEDILKAFNFETLTKMHCDYSLWYINDSGEKVVLSTNNDHMKDPISEEVSFYNLNWHIDVCPTKGWKNEYIEKLAYLIITIISALFAGFILLVFRIRRDGNKMKSLAEEDNLTHCYSRYYLNSVMLDSETGNWRFPDYNYSVAIIDIDKFKQINDKFGHIAGDRALVKISEILKNSISKPEKDRIVRFGGDEFIIFFSNIERKTLRIKFQEILSQVEQVCIPEYPDMKLTLSMGVAIPEGLDDTSYKNMVKVADEKLYQVKENGRNNYLM